MRIALTFCIMLSAIQALASDGLWTSKTTGESIPFSVKMNDAVVAKDFNGKPMTVVYLENLAVQKIGQNSNEQDVDWLVAQGYQVIELDYKHHAQSLSPYINQDIVAINNELKNGSFCDCTCSEYRSYILMEGYRIQRDIAYYHDDPTVYNFPDVYKDSEGDSLYLDLVYPANPSVDVPVLVTFSYSNSFATNAGGQSSDKNKHKRMYLPYYWGGFNDSFVEGASAVGVAWAVCDHPKYCDWGQGKYTGGANKSLGAIEVNPDASRKVKSAIRTIRSYGKSLGLNGKVAVTGFSRGSTAASLAVGNKKIEVLEDAARGRFPEEESSISCALLGPGVFAYDKMGETSREYKNMSAYVTAFPAFGWDLQGALYTISSGSAPCFLFYNTSDDANYKVNAEALKALLDANQVETEVLTDYGQGHSVPQSMQELKQMYDFLLRHTAQPAKLTQPAKKVSDVGTRAVDLLGRRALSFNEMSIISNRKVIVID